MISFSENATIKNLTLSESFLKKLAETVFEAVKSPTIQPRVLILGKDSIAPLTTVLKQKSVLVQVVKTLHRGVFSWVVKHGLFDLGLYFWKQKNQLNLTMISGNGYYISDHIKSLFETRLNDGIPAEKSGDIWADERYADEKWMEHYCRFKKQKIHNTKKIKVACRVLFLKKVLKEIFGEQIVFLSKSDELTKNYVRLTQERIFIFQNGKKVSNKEITKKIEKAEQIKIFQNSAAKTDEEFIISALKNRAKTGQFRGRWIFLDDDYTFDVIHTVCQLFEGHFI